MKVLQVAQEGSAELPWRTKYLGRVCDLCHRELFHHQRFQSLAVAVERNQINSVNNEAVNEELTSGGRIGFRGAKN